MGIHKPRDMSILGPPCLPPPCPHPYPVELPAQAVEGLQLTLPADVGLIHGEEIVAVLFSQEAAWFVATSLGRGSCEVGADRDMSQVGVPMVGVLVRG